MASPREPKLALELAIATLDHYPATAIARLWKANSAREDCLRAMFRLPCPAIYTFLFPRRRRALLFNSSTSWATNPSFSRCRIRRSLCAATDRRRPEGEKQFDNLSRRANTPLPDGMRRPVSSGMRYAPNVRRARGTKKRRPAMQKISTMRTSGKRIFKGQLTIGLDLGDRSSSYCVLNEAGEVILEQKLPTTPDAMRQTFARM